MIFYSGTGTARSRARKPILQFEWVYYMKRRWNFTLIELMIVLAIVLSMGTVLSIQIVDMVKQQRFHSAAGEVLSRLQMAQELMLTQRNNVRMVLNMKQDPSPHLVCTLTIPELQQNRTRGGHITALERMLDGMQEIRGVADVTFTDLNGGVHTQDIVIRCSAAGNHITAGYLRLYAQADHHGMHKTIIIHDYPHPLRLVEGEPAGGPGAEVPRTAVQSGAIFPWEIYDLVK